MKGIFQVKRVSSPGQKSANVCPEIVDVYHVRDDKYGYPQFLVYYNYQWKYESAKHFMPLSKFYG